MAKYTRKDEDPVVMAHKGYQELLKTLDPDSLPKEKEKNPAAVALGKLGGTKGGKARAESLSVEQRRNIAKKAAQKRWQKKD